MKKPKKKKVKWEKDPVKEWEKRGLLLEKQGFDVTVIGRYPKPGFGMPRETDKR
jgi:hypothetical protein